MNKGFSLKKKIYDKSTLPSSHLKHPKASETIELQTF